MALIVADRVKETTNTTGTGTLSLAGVVAGFQSFVAGVGTTNTTYYAITDSATGDWEVGIGTVTSGSPTLFHVIRYLSHLIQIIWSTSVLARNLSSAHNLQRRLSI